MASVGPVQQLCEELSCSICLEYFKDPVSIAECGHNFCRDCLIWNWGRSEGEDSCPQCREKAQQKNLRPNRQLANIVEIAKKLSIQQEGGTERKRGGNGRTYETHVEPLKLFYNDGQGLICSSKGRQGHSISPLGAASHESMHTAEMKVKEEPTGEMEEQRKRCRNCKHEVAVANFSLHEAHCVRFLAICPKCDEPVALKDMKEHFAKAHKEVRCNLCHQLIQQYLLEHHKSEECPERPIQCQFCELDLPVHKLQAHLNTCGSRTTSCWHCGKYVMYKALKEHKVVCQAKDQERGHNHNANLCQNCHSWFPDEKFLQHLNECSPLPRLLGALTTLSPADSGAPSSPQHPPSPTSTAWSETVEGGARPKKKELPQHPPSPTPTTWSDAMEGGARPKKKELTPTGRPSLKPPKSKKLAFVATLASAVPHDQDSLYDTLAACSQCDILLPRPTLQKHEEKCRGKNSLLRRSPRLIAKREEST